MAATKLDSTSFKSTLFVALELSHQSWKLAFLSPEAGNVRVRNVAARCIGQVEAEILLAKEKWGLPEETPVQTCYEAGRDGFWIHRVLTAMGICNIVIESSSLEVDRRSKQRKTDRLDAEKMVRVLARYCGGEKSALRSVRVPGAEDEDIRNLQRELNALRQERTRNNNRIKSLLCAQGIVLERIDRQFPLWIKSVQTGHGQPLGETLRRRLLREFERMQLCVRQIREVETQRASLIQTAIRQEAQADKRAVIASRLMDLCGVGVEAAWTLSTELFAWREFENRKQVAAVVGLVPTPYDSGERTRDQGISKAGRGDLRALLVEISWLWRRYQPTSKLSRWFADRVGETGTRVRRISIVALARKLLIALWKYAMWGEIPEGARFKSDTQKNRFRLTGSLG